MKVSLNETAFFVALQSRLAAAQLDQLNVHQVEVLRKLMYEGLGLAVEPTGVNIECGTFVLKTLNRKGEVTQEQVQEPVLASNFILPGFPIEENVVKVSMSFDARSSDPVVIDLTIFPFVLEFPTSKTRQNES